MLLLLFNWDATPMSFPLTGVGPGRWSWDSCAFSEAPWPGATGRWDLLPSLAPWQRYSFVLHL